MVGAECPTRHSRCHGGLDTFSAMILIDEIRTRVSRGEFVFSEHAVGQAILRQITVDEVRETIRAAVIIEDYPEVKYGPSCLVFGFTSDGRPLHVQFSYPSPLGLKIITLYEPDSEQWIEFRNRRSVP
jgi:hypothetical protein